MYSAFCIQLHFHTNSCITLFCPQLKLEKDKMEAYTRKAMRSVSDWNRSLLKQRAEKRRAYFDMQTFV